MHALQSILNAALIGAVVVAVLAAGGIAGFFGGRKTLGAIAQNVGLIVLAFAVIVGMAPVVLIGALATTVACVAYPRHRKQAVTLAVLFASVTGAAIGSTTMTVVSIVLVGAGMAMGPREGVRHVASAIKLASSAFGAVRHVKPFSADHAAGAAGDTGATEPEAPEAPQAEEPKAPKFKMPKFKMPKFKAPNAKAPKATAPAAPKEKRERRKIVLPGATGTSSVSDPTPAAAPSEAQASAKPGPQTSSDHEDVFAWFEKQFES